MYRKSSRQVLELCNLDGKGILRNSRLLQFAMWWHTLFEEKNPKTFKYNRHNIGNPSQQNTSVPLFDD